MADESQRHRIEVTCPECGQVQSEPALVVSTLCRGCRANFQVRNGKGVVRSHPVTRFAVPRKDSDPEPEPLPEAPRAQPFTGLPLATPPHQSFLMKLLHPIKPPREIACFNCGHEYTAIAEAQS